MNRIRRASTSLVRRFARSESGVAAPLLGVLLLMLIGFIGFAIDIGRTTLVKARLSDALDAAGLAVGARLSTSDYTADATKFVTANFAPGYVGATVKTVTATVNSTKSVITLTASAELPTTFMKLFGTKLVTVNAASEVTRASTGLELVMVLDNTGSMDDSGSMPTLKSAAKSLLDNVFGADTIGENLYVGLVPFSHTVNIGTARSSWMTGTKPWWWGFAGAGGCVMARGGGGDQTDDPPTSTATKFSYYGQWDGNCPKPIISLTNVKATITAGIDALTANGNTHINLGAVWGWRVLSPRWRGYWDSGTLPLDYGTKRMSKAAVIMTDGQNTMNSTTYTAYGDLSDNRLGTTDGNKAETELDNRLTKVCNSMKAQGILVYTVAFNIFDTGTKTLLQNCATTTAYYFDAGNQAALKSAFQTIGDSLSNLRVSK